MFRRQVMLTMAGVLLISLFFGCAFGQQIRYDNVALDLKSSGTFTIAVSVLDNRADIISGEKQAAYIGKSRATFGNAFDILTKSKKPLAHDITNVVCDSLKEKGYQVTAILVNAGEANEQVIQKLLATGSDRVILVTVTAWYSDTYINTALHYDVQLSVMNKQGKVMARSSVKGEDDLKGSAMDPIGHAKKVVPEAYKSKLEILLNSADVLKALK
ncbi:MAG: hypothetical protein JW822_13020 [Spirochaetales bacterium]|nr:hypothetical protein [Spirochaetales bacterium]